MSQIILCKCYFGGYDCPDCGGSGVVILHGTNDYLPLKVIGEKLTEDLLPLDLTIRDKVMHHVEIDEKLIQFLKKHFYKFPLKRRLMIISLLGDRLKKWNSSIDQINDIILRQEVLEYILELSSRIRFFGVAAYRVPRKKSPKSKRIIKSKKSRKSLKAKKRK